MSRLTVDELLAELQRLKDAGLPGDTVTGISSLDNNGRSGVISFEVCPHVAGVAKAEFEKNWTQAKVVSRSGVKVLVLG